MFNLDSLNEKRLEIMQNQAWMNGCIPESPDSFIESLEQMVDRRRFRFELGDSSSGPRLVASHAVATQYSVNQQTSLTAYGLGSSNIPTSSDQYASPHVPSQPTNLNPNMKDLSPFELLTLGLGPPSSVTAAPSPTLNIALSCSEDFDPVDEEVVRESSRKRIKKEIENFGRNIKQRLLCAMFDKEASTFSFNDQFDAGLWEAGQQQLPQEP